MTYIICYDINNNKIRNRLARFLEKKGKRLQKSVFTLEIKKHYLKEILKQISNITGKKGDVIVIRQCKGCKQKSKRLFDEEEKIYYI